MQECKCSHCIKWLFFKTKGFCLVKDLFTYTELEEDAFCSDFVEGEPQTEEEYEGAQLFLIYRELSCFNDLFNIG